MRATVGHGPAGPDLRRHPRQRTRLRAGRLADPDNRFLCDCGIYDVSRGGARLTVPEDTLLPDELVLYDELTNTVALATVRWRAGSRVGISYDVPPAKLKYFSSPRLRALSQRYYALAD
ncbi:PilZ domain-containing protein [Microvirga tunisiensis]|uniref:PilZ domain-containing protein n=2 Tax=Pannonibacter tanglangensis TaxID=2750084 RepID=A0A7X5F4L7_9HYPH|nr:MULTISPECIES: PilZ domain-containing protein [unclassified Pannonibacter]NBN65375.1 PilZ domain-containing protein [Pannonibacter sp. XCT-34]NBN79648.1 PilZ domain-containing protein [Pannonibacter sp. XCT-53]